MHRKGKTCALGYALHQPVDGIGRERAAALASAMLRFWKSRQMTGCRSESIATRSRSTVPTAAPSG
jgi:hypothetical protein